MKLDEQRDNKRRLASVEAGTNAWLLPRAVGADNSLFQSAIISAPYRSIRTSHPKSAPLKTPNLLRSSKLHSELPAAARGPGQPGLRASCTAFAGASTRRAGRWTVGPRHQTLSDARIASRIHPRHRFPGIHPGHPGRPLLERRPARGTRYSTAHLRSTWQQCRVPAQQLTSVRDDAMHPAYCRLREYMDNTGGAKGTHFVHTVLYSTVLHSTITLHSLTAHSTSSPRASRTGLRWRGDSAPDEPTAVTADVVPGPTQLFHLVA
ncbi:hypothetical protein PCL_00566 [Purpureocillium lilacinum]|uniref:Uncharacterized protein n=1 Tax=Purpureocillium lilacinum TaxID=33203 RepID=A0A2U3E5A0_PURLI|nr:hypothetical protein PCL_00566 [Purpureocillium lilacinum]